MYRIYIQDREARLWLMDWIISIGIDHPLFTTKWDYSMKFREFKKALMYHGRLKEMGYEAHID